MAVNASDLTPVLALMDGLVLLAKRPPALKTSLVLMVALALTEIAVATGGSYNGSECIRAV